MAGQAEDRRDWARAAYETAALAYEAAVVPTFRPIAARLATLVAPRAHERGLDLATGTGSLAAALRDRQRHLNLIGLDLSPRMLALARRRAPAAALVLGDALRLPFAAGTFDFVACQFGFHHVADGLAALAELRRVTRPGGRLAIAGWHDTPGRPDPVEAAFRDASAQPASPAGPPDPRRDAAGALNLAQAAGWQASVSLATQTFRFTDGDAYYAWRTAFPGEAYRLSRLPSAERRAIAARTVAGLQARLGRGPLAVSEAVFYLRGA